MVPLYLLIHAQGRKEGLFQNKIAEIEQCEEDKISHVPMMIQKEEVCQFSLYRHYALVRYGGQTCETMVPGAEHRRSVNDVLSI